MLQMGRIATNVSLDKDEIEQLSRHKLAGVREDIARNTATSEEVLMELVKDDELRVVAGLIWNPNFPTSGFQYLMNRVTDIVRNPAGKDKDHWTTYLKNAVNEHKNATEKMREAVNSKDWRWRGDVSIIQILQLLIHLTMIYPQKIDTGDVQQICGDLL